MAHRTKILGIIALVALGITAYAMSVYPHKEVIPPPIAPEIPSTTNTPPPNTLAIGIGETQNIGGVTVTLHSIVQDNRCPVDVLCIEAGAVTASVTLSMGPNSETFNMPSDEVPHTFWGYKVSITDINPKRMSKITPDPNKYHVTFHVEKI